MFSKTSSQLNRASDKVNELLGQLQKADILTDPERKFLEVAYYEDPLFEGVKPAQPTLATMKPTFISKDKILNDAATKSKAESFTVYFEEVPNLEQNIQKYKLNWNKHKTSQKEN